MTDAPTHEMKRLSLQITSHTLVGGRDNPNCFSLASLDGGRDVRVVNMKMGPFQRVTATWPKREGVEATIIGGSVAVLTDSRLPEHEMHNSRWCAVCMPFEWLPPDQQRARLRVERPCIVDGRLSSWRIQPGVVHDDETVERFLSELRAIGLVA